MYRTYNNYPKVSLQSSSSWSSEESARLYQVNDWGCGYFAVSEEGDLVVKVEIGENKISLPIKRIVKGMLERGIEMPSILRIENLLDHRISMLNKAFSKAISDIGYQNHYRGVFPIKVNQQCHVVEEITEFGGAYHHGLEAGSKAELIIALAHIRDLDSLIVCNGYKDKEFVQLGLYAKKMGVKCFFVIETPKELPIIIECSKALGIEPLLGVRIKLSSMVEGYWNKDSGDRSIFGLSTNALMQIVDELKEAEMLSCLQLLHCHIGSQIPNIRNIRVAVQEACRYYCGLVEEGALLGYIDLGGGLAVDYDGSKSNNHHSRNYDLNEYCVDIVETIKETLEPLSIPHPVIITESGRATVAYSSMLLFNILDVRDHLPAPVPEVIPEDSHEQLENLYHVLKTLTTKRIQEYYNDALHYREEIRELFKRGQASIRDRALAENITLAILERIANLLPKCDRIPNELENLPELLSDIYYGNFSLFQSLPDIWAIDQVFPIMPIHRLDEYPERQAIIADLTCDCDGKIDHFASPDGIRNTLPLHKLKDDEEYYLGVFLVGAYQETLGDLHNLFGDTNVVSIRINEDGSFDFVHEFHGDTIGDVLEYVEYNQKVVQEKFRRLAERAVREGRISASMRRDMSKAYRESLQGYTYFER